nr:peptidoglycan DD-metalloendopeptidase family protein [Pseudomonas sp.]
MIVRGARIRSVLVGVCISAAAAPAVGQPQPTIAQREAVQDERRALRSHIEEIQKQIARDEKIRDAAVDELKASEQAISDATRRLAEIQARREQAQSELGELEKQIGSLQVDLSKRQQALAAQLRRQYATGGVTPWSALLSGDNPQESGRTLGYLGYVSQARSAAIQDVRAELVKLEGLQQDATARRAELEALALQREAQRQERLAQQAQRQRVLDDIAVRLAQQRKEASRLTSDEERLSGLIAEINQALEKQAAEAARKRAEEQRLAREREERRLLAEKAAKQAAERQAALARQQKQAAEEAAWVRSALVRREQAGEAAGMKPAAQPAPESAADAGRTAAGAPVQTPQPAQAPQVVASLKPSSIPADANKSLPDASIKGNFADLRGRLRLPARGDLAGRFGQARAGGGTWRGVFIRTPEQTPVLAVAAGTVVFSGWLRGFGNLLILEHGGEYLTVYGNNEAILKEVGDKVSADEAIASAGSSGGQPESGIYFEVRHRGAPVDPLLWAKLR